MTTQPFSSSIWDTYMVHAPTLSDPMPQVAAFLQHLLNTSTNTSLETILLEIREVFEATESGILVLPQGKNIVPTCQGERETPWPWEDDLEIIPRLQESPTAISVPTNPGSFLLSYTFAPSSPPPSALCAWMLWVRTAQKTSWTSTERGALALVSQSLGRWLLCRDDRPRWADQLERTLREQNMDLCNKVIGRLTHDYGNFFTSLVGFAELSLAKPLPASNPVSIYLQELHNSAKVGVDYTTRLRLMSRNRISQTGVCSAGPLITRLAKNKVPSAQLDVPTSLPEAAIDEEQLALVLDVVLQNAVDAVGETGKVTVSARRRILSVGDGKDYYGDLRDGDHLEIVVRDSGTLSAEVRQGLFRIPFFSTKSQKGGLGLATLYGILNSHRGGFRLLGTPEGTEAHMLVPCLRTDRSTKEEAQTQTCQGAKILVVDDDPHVLPMLCATLEQDYQIERARNAEEALAQCRLSKEEPYDLVVADVYMPPGETGVQLAEKLVREKLCSRVLLISGRVTEDFLTMDFTSGFFEFLAKPFESGQLLERIRRFLVRPIPVST